MLHCHYFAKGLPLSYPLPEPELTLKKTKIIYLLAEIGGMGGGGMATLLSEVLEDDPDDSEVAEDVDEEGVIRLLASAGAIGPPTRPEDDSATSTRLPKIKCQEIFSCFGLKFFHSTRYMILMSEILKFSGHFNSSIEFMHHNSS